MLIVMKSLNSLTFRFVLPKINHWVCMSSTYKLTLLFYGSSHNELDVTETDNFQYQCQVIDNIT